MAENYAVLADRFHMELFSKGNLAKGNLAAADEILTPEFVNRGAGIPPELAHGPEGAKRYAQAIRTGFGDEVNISHDDVIVSGDRIVIHWTASGSSHGRVRIESIVGEVQNPKPVFEIDAPRDVVHGETANDAVGWGHACRSGWPSARAAGMSMSLDSGGAAAVARIGRILHDPHPSRDLYEMPTLIGAFTGWLATPASP